MQCSSVQFSAVQCSVMKCSVVQCSVVQCSAGQFGSFAPYSRFASVFSWNVYVCDSGVPTLYHESESIPRVHVYTMSPCQYHEFMSIP